MFLPIEKGKENKILRTVSKANKQITKKTLKFIDDMVDTMFEANGVGIAAPQVSENVRIVICLFDGEKVVPMINPEILDHSENFLTEEEGCLSLPGWWGPVQRWDELTVTYLTPKNERRTIKLRGFNARVMQHEMDHLNAKLFADHVPDGKLVYRKKN
jgi:peptide deformylase